MLSQTRHYSSFVRSNVNVTQIVTDFKRVTFVTFILSVIMPEAGNGYVYSCIVPDSKILKHYAPGEKILPYRSVQF